VIYPFFPPRLSASLTTHFYMIHPPCKILLHFTLVFLLALQLSTRIASDNTADQLLGSRYAYRTKLHQFQRLTGKKNPKTRTKSRKTPLQLFSRLSHSSPFPATSFPALLQKQTANRTSLPRDLIPFVSLSDPHTPQSQRHDDTPLCFASKESQLISRQA
jgi:hypothetical protein